MPQRPERRRPSSRRVSSRRASGPSALKGCLIAAAVLLTALVLALIVGGFALKREVEAVLQALGDERVARESARHLQREHPFQVPADGALSPDQVARYLAVTEEVWPQWQPWADEALALRARIGERATRLRDVIPVVRSWAGMTRAQVVLVEALDAHETSLGEYAWTGIALTRAVEALDAADEARADGTDAPSRSAASGPSAPEANLTLASRYRSQIPSLEDAESGGPGMVLALAMSWGLNELPELAGIGLDTLAAQAGVPSSLP